MVGVPVAVYGGDYAVTLASKPPVRPRSAPTSAPPRALRSSLLELMPPIHGGKGQNVFTTGTFFSAQSRPWASGRMDSCAVIDLFDLQSPGKGEVTLSSIPIAYGGYATVYRGEWRAVDHISKQATTKPVAIKLLRVGSRSRKVGPGSGSSIELNDLNVLYRTQSSRSSDGCMLEITSTACRS